MLFYLNTKSYQNLFPRILEFIFLIKSTERSDRLTECKKKPKIYCLCFESQTFDYTGKALENRLCFKFRLNLKAISIKRVCISLFFSPFPQSGDSSQLISVRKTNDFL